MRVVFPNEMREIDKITIDSGVPSLILMEHAARSLFEEIVKTNALKITILCGAGNNGGDGYALARLLKYCGFNPEVIAVYVPKTKDCRKNVQLYKNSGGLIYRFQKLSKSKLNAIINGSELIVDAIFGTGFKGSLPDEIIDLIKIINTLGKSVLAVDTPSGVNCENGEVCPITFECFKTVTFGALKFGQLLFPARNFLGEIIVADTGFPKSVIRQNSSINLIHKMMAKSILPSRNSDSYKGSYGKVLIIGGSRDYSGAPLLSAMGALRTGAGMVFTFTPSRVQEVIRNKYPEIIALSGENKDLLIEQDIFQIEKLINDVDIIVLGPGIGRNKNTINLIFKIIELTVNLKKYLLIDADALFALAHDMNLVVNSDKTVLTPHPGEFRRLIGEENAILKNNPRYIIEKIKKFKTNILFKDTTSIFTDFNGESWINIHGNTSLAKGGSGDLLSGSIAGFLAQSKDIIKSTILGTYFLGKSAELLGISEAYALPEDVCKGYDKVFSDLLK